jgi:beta-lactamase superfamily II metal-dependent hydrolase
MVQAHGSLPDRLDWLGSGESILLQSRGMTALIDGSPQPFVLLERLGRVLPANTHSIDLVIVTDPRAGNTTGLEAVLQHYTVQEVLDVGAEYPSATYARWRADLRNEHIPAYALRTGATTVIGAASISVLGPDALYANPQDCMGLLRITMNGRTYLLADAASQREQLETVFRPIHLSSDVLVMDGTQGDDRHFVRSVHASRVFATFAILDVPQTRLLNSQVSVIS